MFDEDVGEHARELRRRAREIHIGHGAGELFDHLFMGRGINAMEEDHLAQLREETADAFGKGVHGEVCSECGKWRREKRWARGALVIA